MKEEPDFYKPAEACRIAEVAPYVLRYWETEFPPLSEGKEKGAARLYTGRDVRIIARIRELLYDEGFTVAGAKKRLEAEISEGRFDDGLKPAPSPEEQKRGQKTNAAGSATTAGSPESIFLAEPEPPARTTSAKNVPAPPFAERKNVIRELKEIAKLLDRSNRPRR